MTLSNLEIGKLGVASYKEAQKHEHLSFEFAELAGYKDNGVLENLYVYAFIAGFVRGKRAQREEVPDESP